MHGTIKRLQEGRNGTGVTLNAFRFNAAVNHLMFTGRRDSVYQRIVALTGVRPGDCALDVGTSSGYLATRLAAVTGPSGHVTGVDPAERAIAYARAHAGPGMTFIVGIAQDLDLPESAFDVVTCTLAMHHIPPRQRPAAFAQMYRVTKPGGRLFVADMKSLVHIGGRHPLENMAADAGYQVESSGRLPLLNYFTAIRPDGA